MRDILGFIPMERDKVVIRIYSTSSGEEDESMGARFRIPQETRAFELLSGEMTEGE